MPGANNFWLMVSSVGCTVQALNLSESEGLDREQLLYLTYSAHELVKVDEARECRCLEVVPWLEDLDGLVAPSWQGEKMVRSVQGILMEITTYGCLWLYIAINNYRIMQNFVFYNTRSFWESALVL